MTASGATPSRIKRSALVPFSAKRMFDLVADVQAYPQFLPWCRKASVAYSDGHEMEATLEIAKGPLRKSFTTRNRLRPAERIELTLVEGPFRKLDGCWTFEDLPGDGSRVSLDLSFEVTGMLLRRTLTPVFGEIANTLVDAFCRRARAVYDE